MVADQRARICKFISGVLDLVSKERKTTMFIREMDISRLMTHEEKIKDEKLREKFRESEIARTNGGDSSHGIPIENDELPGILPKRDFFFIDLFPDIQPISIPPCRISPAKLRKLKEQLKEFLNKGFIRPSASLWGAPVLFVRKTDGSLWIAFLGHIITSDGVKVDGQNIEVVGTWLRPLNLIEVRKFLGGNNGTIMFVGTKRSLGGYYQKFVEGLSSISAPL
ncbi:uncharacterized protein LOC129872428 [Solanum dulcamara]|uniref:uncharacterized protein LOC129872428 n=1 Tax=Solanum dulcamara TaxID=45834 RepID=UPI002485FEB0|nr:uncharacterized protein LOC129872428 [Solanum dulcamara]